MSHHRPLTVVVLTWNGLGYTKECLTSIKATTDLSRVKVLVVDNGSTDGTVEYLRGLDWVTPIFNEKNLGFVGGNNIALRSIHSESDVILLNNDTKIEDTQWIEKLQTTANSDSSIGIVGCRIRQMGSNLMQHAGTFMPDFTYWGQQIGGGEVDINQYCDDREVEGVVFACVYIKREVIARVGLLDEDYFSYFEDTDYCFKAKQAGFRVFVCGALTIVHRQHGSTDANSVSFRSMFVQSQEIFVRKWKGFLDNRNDLLINWHSTLFRPIGYAMASRALMKGLEDAAIAVAYRYLYGPGTVFPVAEDDNEQTGDYQLNVIRRRKPNPDALNLIFGQADAFAAVKGAHRIGWTMLETTGIPNEWVRQCNLMDEVWVPSSFNEWTFRRSGVRVPIRVMPLGLIDDGHFNPGIRGRRIEGVFTFLSIFEWGERKAPEILLRAFSRAFRRSDPAVLICKYLNSDSGVDPKREIERLQLDPNGGLILFSENEHIPYYQLPALYRSADCFVLPTRGEGWGMPILEAMACGLPIIASYWSAQQSFMTDANSYPLQVKLISAEAKCPYYAGFQWADPDEDHLVTLFRRVFESPEEARAKGRRAAMDVKKFWSMRASAQRVRARISTVYRDRSPKTIAANDRQANVLPAARIAIDVSRAVGREITGVGRYIISLLKGLERLSPAENPYEYLLLPGFGSFVHPEYLRPLDLDIRGDDRFTVYRGPLPAFANADNYVPGTALVHCTANSWPPFIDGPSVFVVHDLTFLTHSQFHTEENIQLCAENFERAVLSNCLFAPNSHSTRDDLIAHYGVSPERIFVTYPGVDQSQFFPRPQEQRESIRHKYDLPESFFLFVGSLEPRKNLKTVIRAMSGAKLPEVLVVVGASGWKNSELHDLIIKSGTRVKLLGYVPQSDLPALYSAALSTVYISFYEGFGFPVVESMACGTPVITSDNSSLTEIASGAALLVHDPADPIEVRAALERVSADAELRGGLIQSGLARARQFVPEAGARSTIEVYRRLIA